MEQSKIILLEIIKKYPPYSLNSVISGICACFSVYLGVEIQTEEKAALTEYREGVVSAIHGKKYPEELVAAFETLCRFITDMDMLLELHAAVMETSEGFDFKNTFKSLIENELLQQLGTENGTPQQFSNLCISLLDPINGSFYDGTAGICSTTIDAYLYAQGKGGRLDIFTQEINVICHAVAVLRAFLYDIDIRTMYCGDTLVESKCRLNYPSPKLHDFSLMIPPMALSWKHILDEIYETPYFELPLGIPPTSSADWLFVQQQLASLNENGKGIIAMPTGALFNAATSGIRKAAVCMGFIECIITLPANMLPYTRTPISLVIIRGTKKADSNILMIQLEGLIADSQSTRVKDASRLDASIIERICEIYRKAEQITGVSTSVNVSELEKNDWVLLPSRYVRNEVIETDYGYYKIVHPTGDNWTQLHNIGLFYKGINVAPNAKIDANGEYKIINLADVQEGEVILDSLNVYDISPSVKTSRYEVQPGDLLISSKGTVIKICVVPTHIGPVLLSINFIGIRIDQRIFNPLFIKYYLESPIGKFFLQGKQVGTSIVTLTARDLADIPVPILPLDMQTRYLQDLIRTEEKISEEMERLYTQSKQAKFDFYQKIGLGEIMKSRS